MKSFLTKNLGNFSGNLLNDLKLLDLFKPEVANNMLVCNNNSLFDGHSLLKPYAMNFPNTFNTSFDQTNQIDHNKGLINSSQTLKTGPLDSGTFLFTADNTSQLNRKKNGNIRIFNSINTKTKDENHNNEHTNNNTLSQKKRHRLSIKHGKVVYTLPTADIKNKQVANNVKVFLFQANDITEEDAISISENGGVESDNEPDIIRDDLNKNPGTLPNGNQSRGSRYRGVSRNGNQWQVLIMVSKKKRYVGSYSNEIEAARAYDRAALQNHGSKAKTNFDYSHHDIKVIIEEPPILKIRQLMEL